MLDEIPSAPQLAYTFASEIRNFLNRLTKEYGVECSIVGDMRELIDDPKLFKEKVEYYIGAVRKGLVEGSEHKSLLKLRNYFVYSHEIYIMCRIADYIINEGAKLLSRKICIIPGMYSTKPFRNNIEFEFGDVRISIIYQALILDLCRKMFRPDIIIIGGRYDYPFVIDSKGVLIPPFVNHRVIVADVKVLVRNRDVSQLLTYEKLFRSGSVFMLFSLTGIPDRFRSKLHRWKIIVNRDFRKELIEGLKKIVLG